MLFRHICVYASIAVIIILLIIEAVEFTKDGNAIRDGICSISLNDTNEINIIWNLYGYRGNMSLPLTQALIRYINNECYGKGDFTACSCWLTTDNYNYINLGNNHFEWRAGITFCAIGLSIIILSAIIYTIREFGSSIRSCNPEYKMI